MHPVLHLFLAVLAAVCFGAAALVATVVAADAPVWSQTRATAVAVLAWVAAITSGVHAFAVVLGHLAAAVRR